MQHTSCANQPPPHTPCIQLHFIVGQHLFPRPACSSYCTLTASCICAPCIRFVLQPVCVAPQTEVFIARLHNISLNVLSFTRALSKVSAPVCHSIMKVWKPTGLRKLLCSVSESSSQPQENVAFTTCLFPAPCNVRVKGHSRLI